MENLLRAMGEHFADVEFYMHLEEEERLFPPTEEELAAERFDFLSQDDSFEEESCTPTLDKIIERGMEQTNPLFEALSECLMRFARVAASKEA
ncbi:hypothetical protein IPJ70_00790 [Candidatus Campbellbacteria bacterium]|nr:MAG: hypothetical protein IPJ70_00790 [Candidatus Campbellbacteria bacterium]